MVCAATAMFFINRAHDENVDLSNRVAGVYLTGSSEFAKITLFGQEVDATWENLKMVYPNAFANNGKKILSNGDESFFSTSNKHFYIKQKDIFILF